MRKSILGLVAIAAIATPLAFASSANAVVAVTDGTGFVGKGDVQDAFGWNNAQLQANAAGVTFTFESDAQYAQSCMKDNARQTIYKDFKKTVDVDAAVTILTRKNSQGAVTGFSLLGFDGEAEAADMPDDLCNPGNADPSGWVVDPSGAYPEVTQIGGSALGGLFVNFGGESVLLQ